MCSYFHPAMYLQYIRHLAFVIFLFMLTFWYSTTGNYIKSKYLVPSLEDKLSAETFIQNPLLLWLHSTTPRCYFWKLIRRIKDHQKMQSQNVLLLNVTEKIRWSYLFILPEPHYQWGFNRILNKRIFLSADQEILFFKCDFIHFCCTLGWAAFFCCCHGWELLDIMSHITLHWVALSPHAGLWTDPMVTLWHFCGNKRECKAGARRFIPCLLFLHVSVSSSVCSLFTFSGLFMGGSQGKGIQTPTCFSAINYFRPYFTKWLYVRLFFQYFNRTLSINTMLKTPCH